MTAPADIEGIQKPLAIAAGTADTLVSVDNCLHVSAEINKAGGIAELQLYDDAVHGFAVRGDDLNERERLQKEQALQQGVDFLTKYLV